jgi:DNA invertase Pin-like site-specific DNA recombinase
MHKKAPGPPVKLRPEFTGRLVGYARVSTNDQDLSMQISALRRAGVAEDNIWFEHVSGVKAKRPQRDMALLDARKGDVFIVYKLDRLGRSFRELLEMTDDMERRGIGFRSLTEGFDTTKPAGKLLFHMLGALAEFERGLIAERTRDGMAEAKRQGRRMGAPKWFTTERQAEFVKRYTAGESVKEIADSWGKTPNMIRTEFKKAHLKALRRKPKTKAK